MTHYEILWLAKRTVFHLQQGDILINYTAKYLLHFQGVQIFAEVFDVLFDLGVQTATIVKLLDQIIHLVIF